MLNNPRYVSSSMIDSKTWNAITEEMFKTKLLKLNLCLKDKILCALEGVICLQLFMFYSHFPSTVPQS